MNFVRAGITGNPYEIRRGLASMFTLAAVLGVIVVIVVTLVAANTAAMRRDIVTGLRWIT